MAGNHYIEHTVQGLLNITSLVTIHYFEFDDKFKDIPESHDFWELVYVDRGSILVTADDKQFPLEQGELYFHKPYEEHCVDTVKGSASNVFIISFRCQSPAMNFFSCKKIAVDISTKQHISAITDEAQKTFNLPLNNPSMRQLTFKDKGLWNGDQSILIRLELMLIELIRSESDYHSHKPYSAKEIIADEVTLRVIDYMEARLYENMTVKELCTALNFSKSYLAKRFQTFSNYPIMKYYTILKVQEAKRLIRETDKNFSEISEMLMFSNSHYFSNVFRKSTGMTPSQYRNLVKKAGSTF